MSVCPYFYLYESLGYLIIYFSRVLTSFGLLSKILNFGTFPKMRLGLQMINSFEKSKIFFPLLPWGEGNRVILSFLSNLKLQSLDSIFAAVCAQSERCGIQSIRVPEFTSLLFFFPNSLPALHIPNPHYLKAIGNRILGAWNKWTIKMEGCKRMSGLLYPGGLNGLVDQQKLSPVPCLAVGSR